MNKRRKNQHLQPVSSNKPVLFSTFQVFPKSSILTDNIPAFQVLCICQHLPVRLCNENVWYGWHWNNEGFRGHRPGVIPKRQCHQVWGFGAAEPEQQRRARQQQQAGHPGKDPRNPPPPYPARSRSHPPLVGIVLTEWLSSFVRERVSFPDPAYRKLIAEGWRCRQPDRTRTELRALDTLPDIFSLSSNSHLHQNSVAVSVKHKLPGGSPVTCSISRWFSRLLQQTKWSLKSIICSDWNNNAGAWLLFHHRVSRSAVCPAPQKVVQNKWNLLYPPWEPFKQRSAGDLGQLRSLSNKLLIN